MASLQELLTRSVAQNLGLADIIGKRQSESEQLRDIMIGGAQQKAQAEVASAQMLGQGMERMFQGLAQASQMKRQQAQAEEQKKIDLVKQGLLPSTNVMIDGNEVFIEQSMQGKGLDDRQLILNAKDMADRSGETQQVTLSDGNTVDIKPVLPYSKRVQQLAVGKDGQVLSPSEAAEMRDQGRGDEIYAANFVINPNTGKLEYTGTPIKLTAEQQKDLEFRQKERLETLGIEKDIEREQKLRPEIAKSIASEVATKETTKLRIMEGEGAEAIAEENMKLENFFNDTVALLEQLPSGYWGQANILFSKVAANLGQENKVAELASAYDAIYANIGNLARSVGGEKGVLTDQDVQRARGLLPDPGNSISAQIGKLKQVESFLNSRIQSNLKAQGVKYDPNIHKIDIDVTPLERKLNATKQSGNKMLNKYTQPQQTTQETEKKKIIKKKEPPPVSGAQYIGEKGGYYIYKAADGSYKKVRIQ